MILNLLCRDASFSAKSDHKQERICESRLEKRTIRARHLFSRIDLSSEPAADVTTLLLQWNKGKPSALDDLMPLVYAELQRIARRCWRSENPGHTLEPTALVHEAFIRLVDNDRVNWRNRAQFFGVAAQVVRRVLVDHA